MEQQRGALVVGVDDMPESALALRWAVTDARVRHHPLRVVHAYRWPPHIDPGMVTMGPLVEEADVRAYSDSVLSRAVAEAQRLAPELDVNGELVEGTPARALVEHSAGAVALVVGSRGLGAVKGTVLGSVGLTVAAHARCPAVVLRGPQGHPEEGAGVVIGVDGTELSGPALGYAFGHASRHEVPLRAVLCWYPRFTEPGQFADAAAAEATRRHELLLADAVAGWQAKYPEVTVELRVIQGRPTETLVAESQTAYLLVVGAKGRHALPAALLGSVSQGVLHHATCPVAVVHGR